MPYIVAVQHGSHWLEVATELLKCAKTEEVSLEFLVI